MKGKKMRNKRSLLFMLCGMLIIPSFSADTQVFAADRQGIKNEIVVVKEGAKTGKDKRAEDKKEEKTEEKEENEEKPKEESVEESQEKSVEKTEEKSEEKTSSSKEDENITGKKKSKKSKKGKKIKKRRKKSKGRNKKNKKNKQKKNRRNRAKKTGKKGSENKIKNKSDAKNNNDNGLNTKDDKNNKLNKTKAKKSKKGNKNKKNKKDKKNKKGSKDNKNKKKDDKKVNEEKNLDLKEEEVDKIPETDEYKPEINTGIDLGNAGVVNENTGRKSSSSNEESKENIIRVYTVFGEYTDIDGKLRFKSGNVITLPESGYVGFIATGENTGKEDKLTWEGKDLENIKKGIKGNYVLTCITGENVVIGGKDYGKLKFLAYIIVE